MNFEKLGAFYLGKEYDMKGGRLLDRLVMYDARDLTTHAVCIGMTGSGKTGLCIDLLEEAAIDRVPAIIIDPKGDIANLLLTFPDLKPEDFRPWINADDARRKGLTEEQFAAGQAKLWKEGLREWGQDGDRIRLLKESADFTIFTPGSDAGVPVSILQSFSAPAADWETEAEHIRERIRGTVSALLGLIGIEADPIRSREHILLSTIFEHFWRQGSDLDLSSLIMAIQNPPVRQLGVFDVDTFYPQKDRFELAMGLNNLIAAPGFQSWLQGQPLDVSSFLATPSGRCRHSIFSIAHLNDAERMFFVTMLLNQVISWMRAQPGTTSLRALVYMDEIFGFFPPVSNPPSKQPLLTLLKQARAFGLGTVLTTQNPVDLDYKGLSNAGTWFVGRLQTERDKERLLEGLDSVSSGAGQTLDRATISRIISDLDPRVFLLHNVHEEAPVIFQTRWAMSYLRGPLTRRQIRELTAGREPEASSLAPLDATRIAPPRKAEPGLKPESRAVSAGAPEPSVGTAPPHLPPGISQGFLPLRVSADSAGLAVAGLAGGARETVARRLVYRPGVMGAGKVHFINRRRRVDETEPFALLASAPAATGIVNWEEAQTVEVRELADRPAPEAAFDTLPESINEAKEFNALKRDLADHLYRSSTLELLYSPTVKLYSHPRESERDFGLRLQQALRERRDKEIDKLNRSYAGKLRRLENRLRKAEETLTRKETVSKSRKGEVLVSLGESILGAFMGRRSIRGASTTLSKYRQSKTAAMSIGEAREAVAASKKEIAALEEELQEKADEITAEWDEAVDNMEKVPVNPRRADIEVDFFGLVWVPYWDLTSRDGAGATGRDFAPAF